MYMLIDRTTSVGQQRPQKFQHWRLHRRLDLPWIANPTSRNPLESIKVSLYWHLVRSPSILLSPDGTKVLEYAGASARSITKFLIEMRENVLCPYCRDERRSKPIPQLNFVVVRVDGC